MYSVCYTILQTCEKKEEEITLHLLILSITCNRRKDNPDRNIKITVRKSLLKDSKQHHKYLCTEVHFKQIFFFCILKPANCMHNLYSLGIEIFEPLSLIQKQ